MSKPWTEVAKVLMQSPQQKQCPGLLSCFKILESEKEFRKKNILFPARFSTFSPMRRANNANRNRNSNTSWFSFEISSPRTLKWLLWLIWCTKHVTTFLQITAFRAVENKFCRESIAFLKRGKRLRVLQMRAKSGDRSESLIQSLFPVCGLKREYVPSECSCPKSLRDQSCQIW